MGDWCYKLWDMGDWELQNVGYGRFQITICGIWDIESHNMWDMGDWCYKLWDMGDWELQNV